ncbi:MAG TPA: HNH endonuclease [Tepidisphaeraceae bacterium]|jgi:hypothetical protein|nr:HNH endonuclease [Tepidisphaeraceae bacterium]
MSGFDDKQRKAALRRAFRMPAVQSMKSRKTSITNAFVSAIIPVVNPTDDEILEALTILGMKPESVECIYCGDKCNAWDHLWPIVVDRRPTGHISEIANLVPACQPCNSSKGNSHWKKWMLGDAPQSPNRRNIPTLHERVLRLEAYEHWRTPLRVDFEAIVGPEAYAAYWKELDRVIVELEQSQTMGEALRQTIANASSRWQPRPTND